MLQPVDPYFNVPTPSPARVEDKVFVADIARALHQMSVSKRREGVEMSIRWHSESYFRSSSSSSGRTLNRLRNPSTRADGTTQKPWIELSRRPKGTRANHYTLGPAAKPALDEWAHLGEQLLGPMGVLRTFVERPCIAQGYLGTGGCLVLGIIALFEPISRPDLIDALAGLMKRATVDNKTKRLAGNGLIVKDGEKWRSATYQAVLLDQYEEECGLLIRASTLKEQNTMERIAFSRDLEIEELKERLRAEPCDICGIYTKGEMHVEHFPPLHWGAFDDPAFLHTLCDKHNTSFSAAIRDTEEANFERPHGEQIRYPGTDADDFFKDVLEFLYMGITDGSWSHKEIRKTAINVMHAYLAASGYGSGVRLTDTTTGEIIEVPENERRISRKKGRK